MANGRSALLAIDNPKPNARYQMRTKKPKSLPEVEMELIRIQESHRLLILNSLQVCIEEIDRVNSEDFDPEKEEL